MMLKKRISNQFLCSVHFHTLLLKVVNSALHKVHVLLESSGCHTGAIRRDKRSTKKLEFKIYIQTSRISFGSGIEFVLDHAAQGILCISFNPALQKVHLALEGKNFLYQNLTGEKHFGKNS